MPFFRKGIKSGKSCLITCLMIPPDNTHLLEKTPYFFGRFIIVIDLKKGLVLLPIPVKPIGPDLSPQPTVRLTLPMEKEMIQFPNTGENRVYDHPSRGGGTHQKKSAFVKNQEQWGGRFARRCLREPRRGFQAFPQGVWEVRGPLVGIAWSSCPPCGFRLKTFFSQVNRNYQERPLGLVMGPTSVRGESWTKVVRSAKEMVGSEYGPWKGSTSSPNHPW